MGHGAGRWGLTVEGGPGSWALSPPGRGFQPRPQEDAGPGGAIRRLIALRADPSLHAEPVADLVSGGCHPTSLLRAGRCQHYPVAGAGPLGALHAGPARPAAVQGGKRRAVAGRQCGLLDALEGGLHEGARMAHLLEVARISADGSHLIAASSSSIQLSLPGGNDPRATEYRYCAISSCRSAKAWSISRLQRSWSIGLSPSAKTHGPTATSRG